MKREKSKLRSIAMTALFIIIGSSHQTFSAEVANPEIEINRLKKEIAQIRAERQKVRDDISRDQSEFAAYQERAVSRKTEYLAETDSIRRLTESFKRKKDSLDASLGSLGLKKRNFNLMKDRFREHIIAASNALMRAVKKYPPAVSRPAIGALTFLLNDCAAKNIDNMEALQRLVQTVRNFDDASQSIQTGQESSPLPEIRGNVSTLRIGAVFEAVVDEEGKNAALWQWSGSNTPEWKTLSDAESVALISRAIAVRESKSMPALIPLPWGAIRSKETSK